MKEGVESINKKKKWRERTQTRNLTIEESELRFKVEQKGHNPNENLKGLHKHKANIINIQT